MKVTALRTQVVKVPLPAPTANASTATDSFGAVLVFIDTDDGITGENLVWTVNGTYVSVLDEMIRCLADSVVGADPQYSEAVWQAGYRSGPIRFIGHEGVSVVALSAVDGALWDIRGKAADRPIHHLAGGVRAEVPAYHSGGLWISETLGELAAEAERFRSAGFKAMKMRIGKPSIREDVERVRVVREAIGPDCKLMADASRALSVPHAIRLGHELEPFDLYWFEEPLPPHDLEGTAAVAAALDTPVASGESEYTIYNFREMLQAKAADIWMPDLQRAGGVTGFLKVGHLAEAWDIPVSNHFFSDYSLQLLGALPNATYLEYMNWLSPLFNETIEFRNGNALVPTRPGWGFTFNASAIERYRA